MEFRAWLWAHPAVPAVSGVASLVVLIGSALLLPVLVARMPADYFTRQAGAGPEQGRRAGWQWVVLGIKNAVGAALLLVGIAMLFLPGQGLLTILMALGLLDFPGKRTLELRLVRERHVLRAIRWLRRRAGSPPLRFPGEGPARGEGEDASA